MNPNRFQSRRFRNEGDGDGAGGGGTGDSDNNDGGGGSGDGDAGGDKPGMMQSAGGWDYRDGLAGEGDRPEWFDSKFKTVEDQAKAFVGLETLQGKHGNYFGAPEGNYDLTLPEGVTGDFDGDNELLSSFTELAKDIGLSQAGFDKLLHNYVEHDAGMLDNSTAQIARVAEDLGENGEQVIQDTWQRLSSLLPEAEAKALDGVVASADGVRALQRLMSAEAVLPADGGTAPGKMTRDDLRSMKYEKFPEGHAQAGKERYGLDKEFTKRVDNLYKQQFPGDDNKTV